MIFKDVDVHSKYLIRNGRGGRKDYGGFSPCITGKVEIFPGSVLNNCVGLAFGLFALREDNPECKVGFITRSTQPNNAGDWWNDGKQSKWDKYERGLEPREGAIICYGGINGDPYGHVAFVNEINGDELILLSSGYGNTTPEGYNIRKVYRSQNYKWPTVDYLEFQGFIYPLESPAPAPPEPEPAPDLSVGDKVEIVAPGNASSFGNLWPARGIGWHRYVTAYYPGRPFPYQVGYKNNTSSSGTTGFYKKEALKRV